MYELRVLTGLHRGAVLPLIGEQWSIGTEDSCDLVLLDSGIDPQHAQLALADDVWTLTAGGGSTIIDPENQTVERIDQLELDLMFALNGVWFTLAHADTAWMTDTDLDELAVSVHEEQVKQTPAKRSPVPFIFGFITALAISVPTALGALSHDPASKLEPEPVARATVAATAKPVAAVVPMSIDESLGRIRKMLHDRELDTKVKANIRNGQLVLSGTVDDQGRALVQRMVDYYQRANDTDADLINEVEVQKLKLPFEIVQIVTGPMGHVVTSTGKRLFVGDEVDGVRLTSIKDNQLIFKGERDYEVIW